LLELIHIKGQGALAEATAKGNYEITRQCQSEKELALKAM
jgi:hypothetical protein